MHCCLNPSRLHLDGDWKIFTDFSDSSSLSSVMGWLAVLGRAIACLAHEPSARAVRWQRPRWWEHLENQSHPCEWLCSYVIKCERNNGVYLTCWNAARYWKFVMAFVMSWRPCWGVQHWVWRGSRRGCVGRVLAAVMVLCGCSHADYSGGGCDFDWLPLMIWLGYVIGSYFCLAFLSDNICKMKNNNDIKNHGVVGISGL